MLRKKDRRVNIRLPSELKRIMKAAAAAAGMPLSAWIRHVLDQASAAARSKR